MKLDKIITSLLLLFWTTISVANINNNRNITITHNVTYYEYLNLKNELNDLKNENETLKSNIKLTDEKVNQSIIGKSNFIGFISWTTGIVLTFVGLLFGLFSFLMYKDNKKIIKESEEVLKGAKVLKSDFEIWFNLKQEEYKNVIRTDYRKALIILENTSKLEKLKSILASNKLDQKKIYPLVSALAANPEINYKPYFKKIIELNISEEITEMGKKGISKIDV